MRELPTVTFRRAQPLRILPFMRNFKPRLRPRTLAHRPARLAPSDQAIHPPENGCLGPTVALGLRA
jgi:hypothetical protein